MQAEPARVDRWEIDEMKIPANHNFAVIYKGAPYGETEVGEILSTHPTERGAELETRKLNSSPDYYGNVRVIDLDEDRPIRGEKTSYREFFSGIETT
ncbi:MAG: hypothetical protein EB060_10590 [Proteobacteria bacterium]|nr:hypothetical protein [Pseudomonadota bacterium]